MSEVALAAVTVPAAPLLKDDRVAAGRGIEAEAVDGDGRRVGCHAGLALGNHGHDRGDLHRRTAARAVGRDHGGQTARGRASCRTSP